MQFRGMEDRLNPIAPADADESTLGGYVAIHGRSPAFEGSDGMPYTVAIETDAPEAPGGEHAAYLVFLRWAADSTAIMGHLETDDVAAAATAREARAAVERLPLHEVKQHLEAAITRRREWDER